MSGSFYVDPAAVRGLAGDLADVADTIQGARSTVASSAVPGQAWGLVGAFLVGQYSRLRDASDQGLAKVAARAQEIARACQTCASEYEASDGRTVASLEGIGGGLS